MPCGGCFRDVTVCYSLIGCHGAAAAKASKAGTQQAEAYHTPKPSRGIRVAFALSFSDHAMIEDRRVKRQNLCKRIQRLSQIRSGMSILKIR